MEEVRGQAGQDLAVAVHTRHRGQEAAEEVVRTVAQKATAEVMGAVVKVAVRVVLMAAVETVACSVAVVNNHQLVQG